MAVIFYLTYRNNTKKKMGCSKVENTCDGISEMIKSYFPDIHPFDIQIVMSTDNLIDIYTIIFDITLNEYDTFYKDGFLVLTQKHAKPTPEEKPTKMDELTLKHVNGKCMIM